MCFGWWVWVDGFGWGCLSFVSWVVGLVGFGWGWFIGGGCVYCFLLVWVLGVVIDF